MLPVIRDARAADASAVVALLEDEALESEWVTREFRVAADEGGRVVGAVRLKPLPDGTVELGSLVVQPDARHRKVGEALVRDALARAGVPVVALAKRPDWFERFGFRRLASVPAVLAAKADGMCSGSATPIGYGVADENPIRARYATAAAATCCDASCSTEFAPGYSAEEIAALPEGARLSLGTGNPVRAAAPRAGEVVVDLGSGAGIDVLLAAKAVGPSGKAVGVDFTPQMLARARENARVARTANAEFVDGSIDATGLPNEFADAVVSNCVVNLAPDKARVLAEAHRVLKPGGRLVVSDTLREEGTPAGDATADCRAGALTASEWRDGLAAAGFTDVRVETEREDACCGSVGRVLVHAVRPA